MNREESRVGRTDAPPATVVWITGLPGSGKSTLAARARQRLAEAGVVAVIFDGDELREALDDRSHDDVGRGAFYARLARLAALVARQGVVVLVPATANRRVFRRDARLVAPRFLEVWVKTPLTTCMERDPKGLYAAAAAGRAPTLPGVGAPFEAPEDAELEASGGLDERALGELVARVSAPPRTRR